VCRCLLQAGIQAAMRFHFETAQWLPYPHELVFAFFANPANLPRLMPSWQKARLEEATFRPPPPFPEGAPRYASVAAGDGTRLTLSFRPVPLSPLRISWEAQIEDFRWNQGFADTQLRGPFRYWRQQHEIAPAPEESTGAEGTRVTDRIDYELPLPNAMAEVANALVRWQIAGLFRFRHQRTAELLEAVAPKSRR
jgi:ligand-binding SRPBCC domain-containing protein